ncbi:MAG: hypothetical protein MR873_02925 [Parabacteroides sp.]|nr:hypothetical protein [Parabacteroides sp.]
MNKTQLRELRTKLYRDKVFALMHKQLTPLLTEGGLSIFELFATADVFTEYFLENSIEDPSFFEYEVDDLNDEVEIRQDLLLILIICYYKLLAMVPEETNAKQQARQPNAGAMQLNESPIAEEESPLRLTQRAYSIYCEANPEVMELMGYFSGCKEALSLALKQPGDQSSYQLLTREKKVKEDNPDAQMQLIHQLIAQRESLDNNNLQTLELMIRRVSSKHNGAFNELADDLQEYLAERMRSATANVHVQGDYVIQKRTEKQINSVNNGGVGVSIKPTN